VRTAVFFFYLKINLIEKKLMSIFQYEDRSPRISDNCYIADSAEVIGDVRLGPGCYVGPGAIMRGDYGSIVIGENTAVEEGVIIHARKGEVCTIGNWVTLGHGAVIHNVLKIEDYAVIGMGSVISDYALVGEWAAIGEGAVVRNRQEITPGAVAVGVPAKIIGETDEEYRAQWMIFKNIYVDLAHNYRKNLKRIG